MAGRISRDFALRETPENQGILAHLQRVRRSGQKDLSIEAVASERLRTRHVEGGQELTSWKQVRSRECDAPRVRLVRRFGMLEVCRLLTDEGRRALIGTSLLLDIISERSVRATCAYFASAKMMPCCMTAPGSSLPEAV
eukprot:s307_g14.t1